MQMEDKEELVKNQVQNLRKSQNSSLYFFNLYKKYQNGTVYVNVFDKLQSNQMLSIINGLKNKKNQIDLYPQKPLDFHFLLSCIDHTQKIQARKYFSYNYINLYKKNSKLPIKTLKNLNNEQKLTLLSNQQKREENTSSQGSCLQDSHLSHLSNMINPINNMPSNRSFSHTVFLVYQSLIQFFYSADDGQKPLKQKSLMNNMEIKKNAPFKYE